MPTPVPQLENIVGLPPAVAASYMYVSNLQKDAEDATAVLKNQEATLLKQESLLFQTCMVCGALTILLILAGVALMLLRELAFGTLSAVVGLLSGGGSAAFRRAANATAASRQEISKQRSEDKQLLRALSVTMLIPDESEKTKLLVKLAAQLTEPIGDHGGPRSPSRRR